MSHTVPRSTSSRSRRPGLWSRSLSLGIACSWFGTALAAGEFVVSPQTLAFGAVPTGASKSLQITITNVSAQTLTPNFSGGAPNDPVNFGGSQNCAGKTFAPNATCTFTYEFTPRTVGAKSSSTTIGINSDNFSITMSGTGLQAFSVSPQNLVFGNVAVGATKQIAVVIRNTSGVAQTPNFSGGAPIDPDNFGGSQNCAGKTFAPNATCTFTYEFTPVSVGPKSSNTTIGIDSENYAITMSGTGVGAFSVSPQNLMFGNVAVGATKEIAVVITNTSGVTQSPNFSGGAPIDPTHFGGSQDCAGKTFAPGATCRFTYEFTPASLGAKSTTTTIGIDSQNFAITMSGTGVAPGAFSVSPSNLAFRNVPVGASRNLVVTVTNVSSTPRTPNFSGGAPLDSTNFDASQNCAGRTLAPGGTCTYTYTFQPATPGAKSTSTVIGVDAETFTITMSGTGVLLAVEFRHAAFDHYFVTTIADEITKLDNGTFAGWARTGREFKVFAAANTGLEKVCRFFSAAFAPKSSHFYTPFAQECTDVKANPDWEFEGEVFLVSLPAPDGSCPANTIPVYRLYNDGKGEAPNHRFTTELDVRSEMIAQGWIPEGTGIGVGMCAPA